MKIDLDIPTPKWALPLLKPKRFKGARGGRGGGKSHFFAELLVEEMLCNPGLKVVCIREIQKSLKYSVKSLVESKIQALGVGDQFEVLSTEIRRKGGKGLCIFQGMQDHTADTIKSLEGFDRCFVEESQSISNRSIKLLLPTIRKTGSEIWFGWNPEYEDDPVDILWNTQLTTDPDAVLVTVNLDDNPFKTEELIKQRQRDRITLSPEEFSWIWEGDYKRISDHQILKGKWEIKEFEPGKNWGDPLHGADWGDIHPTTAVRVWLYDDCLWVEFDSAETRLELDDIARQWKQDIPDIDRYVVRADPALPATIRHVKKTGIPKLVPADKWPNSVDEGIKYLRSFRKIYVHPRCRATIDNCRRWSYKADPRTNDPLPVVIKLNDDCIDAIRYALAPLILAKSGKQHTPTFNSERSAANTRQRIGGVKRDGRVFQ